MSVDAPTKVAGKRTVPKFGAHTPDGTDAAGEKLPVVIRILPDGRLYTHDITAAILPVFESLCPNDAVLAARVRAMKTTESEART